MWYDFYESDQLWKKANASHRKNDLNYENN